MYGMKATTLLVHVLASLVVGGVTAEDLPADYIRLEGVLATKGQYVNTGITPDGTVGYEIEGDLFTPPTESVFILGSRVGFQNKALMLSSQMWYKENPAACGITFAYGNAVQYTQAFFSNGVFSVKFMPPKATSSVPGVTADFGSQTTWDNDKPIYLFAGNNNGTPSSYAKMGLRMCKLYKGGNVVRDFVPAKNAQGVVGLFDRCSGEFFVSATATALEEPGVPFYTRPTRFRYVESSNAQYVDTGIVPDDATGFRMIFQPCDPDGSGVHVFGSRNAVNVSDLHVSILWNANDGVVVGYGSAEKKTGRYYQNQVVDMVFSNKVLAINGETLHTFNNELADAKYPLYIFAIASGGSWPSGNSKIRLYSAQIWKDGDLVRDLTPEGVGFRCGLRDHVTGALLVSGNSTSLIPGPLLSKGLVLLVR